MAQPGDRGRLGPVAFGLGLLTDLALPGAWAARPQAEPTLRLCAATPREVAASWSGLESSGWEGTIAGAPFRVERGRAGDHRFVHGAPPDRDGAPRAGTRAVHHLSADARELRCAPTDPGDPSWWREVLDSVLFTVALLRGYEALHAGAVATPAGALAITAATGAGKSTLVSELLAAGLTLVADDVLVLEPAGAGPPRAHPAPPVMNVPTVRLPALREALAAPVEPLAALAQERWVAVPVYPEPLPLAALVVLSRRPGLPTELRRAEWPLAALLRSLLRFPRERTRERTRFEVAGALAAHVPIWELSADPSVTPAALAEVLLGELSLPRRAPAPSAAAAR